MTKLIALALLSAIFSASALAAPAINVVSGTVSADSAITITGSGFGSKSPALPWLFDDFSGGTDGALMTGRTTPVGGRLWKTYQASGVGTSLNYNTMAYSAPFSGYQNDTTGSTTNQDIYVEGQNTPTRYVSYQFRWTDNGSGTRVWKMDRSTSGTTNNPPYDSPPHSGWGDYIYVQTCPTFTNIGWIPFPPKNSWNRIENYIAMGTQNVANGTYWLSHNNATLPESRFNDLLLCSSGCGTCQVATWMSPLIANNTNIIQTWIDDVYIDNTRARIEMCEGSTASAKSACSLMIPTAWSATSITATVKTGKFVSGTYYLYVYDSTGAVNASGYPVTLSSGGGTTYTATCSAGSNGTCAPASRTVGSGQNTTFTVTPATGYTGTVAGTCGGSPSTSVGEFVYTTNAINANCSVTVTFAGDTTPPVISAPLPSGEQPYGTASVTLQATTNEAATCRYSATDVAYASMSSTFGTTGGTTHQQTGFATTNGSSYTRYVRCIDIAGNASAASTPITFSVAATDDVILDNDGAGATQSGEFGPSTYFPGYYGANYHYAPNEIGHWFQWTTDLTPGSYAVYARWPAAAGRPTDAVYEIINSVGTASVSANQTINGSQWNLLGTYNFGATGTVRLLSSATGTEGAAADAIRFALSAADTTPPTLSGLSPSGSFASSTASVALGVSTSESATCRHGRSGSAWASKTDLSSTGGTSHSATIQVWPGMVERICFACRDAASNESAESCTAFWVAPKPKRGQGH